MIDSDDDKRWLIVDASVFISLVLVDSEEALQALNGYLKIPEPVKKEISDDPARTKLDHALDEDQIETCTAMLTPLIEAADYLGHDLSDEDIQGYGHSRVGGDIAILAIALQGKRRESIDEDPVVITDDKSLRKTCNMLSIPVSGSIGVLIRGVERGEIDPNEAKETLYAMDEVGARMSVSLIKKAERLIDDAAEKEWRERD